MTQLQDKKQAIKLLSFNANGLRDDKKRRSLFHWLKKFHDASNKIILLQETHTDVNNVKQWINDWGHPNIIFAHGDSLSRGVAILLPSNVEYTVNLKECDPEGRFIAINITIEEQIFWIINCYAPTSSFPKEQLTWLSKIQCIIEVANDSSLIIGGDLNDYFIPFLDKYKPKPNLTETDYIKAWKATCDDSGLCDIWRTTNPNVKRYTWRHGKKADTLKQSRLDYWLVSNYLLYNLDSVDIKTGFRSDHSLIDLTLFGQHISSRGPSFWRFNASLLRNTEYTDYMNNRIEEIKDMHTNIEDKGLLWDTIKMEIRASTICF
jgi:exonuclease III